MGGGGPKKKVADKRGAKLKGEDITRLWKNIHFPSSFSSAQYFSRALKKAGKQISANKVERALEKEPDFQVTRKRRKKFARRPFYATFFNQVWQADVFDVGKRALQDKKYGIVGKYGLFCIDAFSRHVFIEALSDRSAEAMRAAFQRLKKNLRPPYTLPAKLITDRGLEFRNKKVRDFLSEENGVYMSVATQEHKAFLAERGIKSAKKILLPLLASKPHLPWAKALKQVATAMNRRYHRSIKMCPNDVEQRWRDVQKKALLSLPPLLDFPTYMKSQEKLGKGGSVKEKKGGQKWWLGKKVFVPLKKSFLAKETDRNYSYEIYTVKKIFNESRPFLFRLEDGLGRPAPRLYYGIELKSAPSQISPAAKSISNPVVKKTTVKGGEQFELRRYRDRSGRLFDRWVRVVSKKKRPDN